MNQTILLVEPLEDDVFLFRRALVELGFTGQVRVVSSIGEAREYLKGWGRFADRRYFPQPDLIVFSLKTLSSRRDFMRWLRAQPGFGQTPLVVFSDANDALEWLQVVAEGGQAFVPKAKDFRDSLRGVESILRFLPKMKPGEAPEEGEQG